MKLCLTEFQQICYLTTQFSTFQPHSQSNLAQRKIFFFVLNKKNNIFVIPNKNSNRTRHAITELFNSDSEKQKQPKILHENPNPW